MQRAIKESDREGLLVEFVESERDRLRNQQQQVRTACDLHGDTQIRSSPQKVRGRRYAGPNLHKDSSFRARNSRSRLSRKQRTAATRADKPDRPLVNALACSHRKTEAEWQADRKIGSYRFLCINLPEAVSDTFVSLMLQRALRLQAETRKTSVDRAQRIERTGF